MQLLIRGMMGAMKKHSTSRISPTKSAAPSGAKLSGKKGEQLTLFDKSDYDTPAPQPGEMSMDEWVETQNPVYHGSMRSDWTEAPVHHFGSKGQAEFRVLDQASHIAHNASSNNSYYGLSDKAPDEFTPVKTEHEGRVYARRFVEPVAGNRLTDEQANAAEAGFRWEENEHVPSSTLGSSGMLAPDFDKDGWGDNMATFDERSPDSREARSAMKNLQHGKAISYDNRFETPRPGEDNTSFVAPPEATTSWERDVLRSPRAAEGAKRFAKQRIDSGREGSVPFRVNQSHAFPNKQLSLEGKVHDKWDTPAEPSVVNSYQFQSDMSNPKNQGETKPLLYWP